MLPTGWPKSPAVRRSAAAALASAPTPQQLLGQPAQRALPAARRALSVRAEAAGGNGSAGDSFDYDLFCIGAGSGGVRASRVAAGTYGMLAALRCHLLQFGTAGAGSVVMSC